MSETPTPEQAVTSADRAALVALYREAFGKEDGQAVLPWRYDASPHGPSISLISRLGGAAVGAYACNARRVLLRGEPGGTVGETGDVMTHPEHRGRGYFMDLDRAALALARERGWSAVIGLPNSRSADIFTSKLGWRRVGSLRPWTFVLTTEDGARRERRRAGRLASVAVPWAAWRGSMRRGSLRKRSFGRINVVAIPRFDERVDALVSEVAKDHAWMQERSADFLNWRFIEAPSQRFRAHGVYAPEGSLEGYVVVQLPAEPGGVGWVVDLVARSEAALAGALEAALGHLQKVGASVARATAVEGSWWEATLRDAGFRAPARADRKQIIVHVLRESDPLAQAALAPSDWYFTDADRDDETCS